MQMRIRGDGFGFVLKKLLFPGVMDPSSGPAHIDGGRVHVYLRPAIPGVPLPTDRRLDSPSQVGSATRRRGLRVPGVDSARTIFLRYFTRCR